MTECPKCGGTEGVYTLTNIIRVPYRRGFDGAEQDNGEMYDQAAKHEAGNIIYCQDCNKQICRLSTFEKLIGEE